MRSDAELLADYSASGCEEAFSAIASRHGAMVYRVCLSTLRDPHEAEDASQATFLVLARKARGLRSGTDLAGWLYGTARKASLWAARNRATRRRKEEAAAMARAAAGGDEGRGTGGGGPDTETLCAELDRLPVALRQAVLLRYAEGLSQQEAAAAAGCPQGTLGRRAAEGLERLRERLARRGSVLGIAAVAGLFETQAAAAVPASLLPSILAVPKLAAAGAAAGAAGLSAVALGAKAEGGGVVIAEGVMKAMFWTKMKFAAAVLVGAAVVGGGGAAAVLAAAEPAAPKAESPRPTAVEAVPASDAEPRDPGAHPDRSAAAWQKLFADEAWYKGQAGAERIFTGKLEGVPVGGPSTLQRNSLYKLGDRNIYTGAKKIPALDALVGKNVEIRGKAVDMNLEGQELKEIWPAEVREAGAATGGATIKLDPNEEIRGTAPTILPVGPPVQAPAPGAPEKP